MAAECPRFTPLAPYGLSKRRRRELRQVQSMQETCTRKISQQKNITEFTALKDNTK